MAVPGSEQPNPSPSSDAAQPAPKTAVDATKYVGTPAVGTSKAAASAGLSSSGPSNTEVDRRRRRLVWVGVTAFLTAWFLAFFDFFFLALFSNPTRFSRLDIRRSSRLELIRSFSRNTAFGSTARLTVYL